MGEIHPLAEINLWLRPWSLYFSPHVSVCDQSNSVNVINDLDLSDLGNHFFYCMRAFLNTISRKIEHILARVWLMTKHLNCHNQTEGQLKVKGSHVRWTICNIWYICHKAEWSSKIISVTRNLSKTNTSGLQHRTWTNYNEKKSCVNQILHA